MPTVTIDEVGCRDCTLCVEICPTKVFEDDAGKGIAKVVRKDDCIGCTSCVYICPSRCITVKDYEEQRPFFRIEENAAIVSKFLQRMPAAKVLTEADYKEALKDVFVRVKALGDSVTETMGRGQKAVGRKAGQLAASHLPEMYEGKDLADVLAKMKHRFANSFDFDATIGGDGSITMKFPKCAFGAVVTETGDKIGEAVLCHLFHEYWAGLVGAFTSKNYNIEMVSTGNTCTMKLTVR